MTTNLYPSQLMQSIRIIPNQANINRNIIENTRLYDFDMTQRYIVQTAYIDASTHEDTMHGGIVLRCIDASDGGETDLMFAANIDNVSGPMISRKVLALGRAGETPKGDFVAYKSFILSARSAIAETLTLVHLMETIHNNNCFIMNNGLSIVTDSELLFKAILTFHRGYDESQCDVICLILRELIANYVRDIVDVKHIKSHTFDSIVRSYIQIQDIDASANFLADEIASGKWVTIGDTNIYKFIAH